MIDTRKKYRVKKGIVLFIAENPNDGTLIGLVHLTEKLPIQEEGEIVIGNWTLDGKSIPPKVGYDLQEVTPYDDIPVDAKVLATGKTLFRTIEGGFPDDTYQRKFNAHFSHYNAGKVWVFANGKTSHTSCGLTEVQHVELV